jgi:glycosyltransferase involved in cell wall biosynthesis
MVANLFRTLAGEHDVLVATFDPIASTSKLVPPKNFVPLGKTVELPMALRWCTYLWQAILLANCKRQLGIELTISNLWRADLINSLISGEDIRIAVGHTSVRGNPTNRVMVRFAKIVAAMYRRFDAVVAVSGPLKNELASLYGLDHAKVHAIPNFVFVDAPVPVFPPKGRERLVWCGRLVVEKNPLVLIDIFKDLWRQNEARQLLLIGDGPLKAQTKELAESSGLRVGYNENDEKADVIFTGAISKPFPLVAGSALMLLPSLVEGLPVVLLEALALGVPVAAADCRGGGISSVLTNASTHTLPPSQIIRSECGLLLPIPCQSKPATIEQWVQEVDSLLRDTVALKAMQRGARRRSQDFSPHAAREKWLKLINDLIEQKTGGRT